MMRKRTVRQIAFLLTLTYLSLSGLVAVGIGRHALEHGHSPNHAAQHASFICTWMCAATSFAHSADQTLSASFNPPFERTHTYARPFFSSPSILSLRIRPPPHSFLY